MKTCPKCVVVLAMLSMAASSAMGTVSFMYGGRTYTSNLGIQMAWPVENSGHNPGGAFEAHVVSITGLVNGSISGLHGDKDPSAGQAFNTFCVESQIANLSVGGTVKYVATIDTFAAKGSGNQNTGESSAIDPLEGAAAWIYRQYITQGNKIAKPDNTLYTNQEISHAIWALEENLSLTEGSNADTLRDAAMLHLNDPLNGVRVLNLWTLTANSSKPYGWAVTDIQSQLVWIPAPAAAGLVFVGLGLIGWFRRKLA